MKKLAAVILMAAILLSAALGLGVLTASAAAVHTHDMSVACQNSGVTFTEWIGSDMDAERPGIQITGGSYYLTGDVNITEENKINIPADSTVNLCLNGHSFTMNGTTEKIGAFMVSGTLNICDCSGGGSISYDACSGVYVGTGTVNIYGGTFSDKYGIYNFAGTLCAYAGTFDGTVVDFYNRNAGCGIYLTGSPTLDSIYVEGHYSPNIYASVGGVPYAGGQITLEYAELDEDYCIGMTAVQRVTDANKDKFTIKNDGWSLSREENTLKLDMFHTIHNWSYTAEDKDNDGYKETVNAYCAAVGNCNSTANKTITILPPAMKASDDGNDPNATVADGKTTIGGRTEERLPDFYYYVKDGNTWRNHGYVAPTAPGTYKATLTLYPVVAEVVYTIAVPAHTHSWTYTANGNTITAICQTADCPVTGTKTIVISAVSKTYDGTAVTATVTNTIDNTDHNANIVYEAKTGSLTGGKAVNVGTYRARLTVGGATASVDFEITPVIYDVTVTDDGNGTAFASPSYGAQGTRITLTATPHKGYRFKEWKVENDTVTVENNSFTMPADDVAIKAIFIACSHTDGSATYTAADSDTRHTATYTCCGAEVSEDHFAQKSENKATCTTRAICDACGESYGEVDETNHNGTVAYQNGFCPHCDACESATLNADGYYEIASAGQLYWFADHVNNVDKAASAVLVADIDLEGRSDGTGRRWTPIGETNEARNNFRGVFDGQHHTITGLYVEGGRAGLGFFGEVRTGIVRNFTIYGDVVVNTDVSYVGGVIGSACGLNSSDHGLERNGAIIQNITSYVNLTAKAHGVSMVGGFLGYANHATLIENCSWYGTFDAGEFRVDSGAGGFIGRLYDTSTVTVRNCAAYGTIKTAYKSGTHTQANGTPHHDIYIGGFLSFSPSGAQTVLENNLFAGKIINNTDLDTAHAHLSAFGTLSGDVRTINCYALNSVPYVTTGNAYTNGISTVTEGQLASGEVAYLLGSAWGQALTGENRQSYPVLGGARVYCGYTTCDVTEAAPVYTNISTTAAKKPAHQMAAATCAAPSICTVCGHTEGEATGKHSYDNDCDVNCNICGAERTVGSHTDADENALCDACGTALPKNGLSAGAIVGIVLGSVAVVGIGGFCLYWFVIRKRR